MSTEAPSTPVSEFAPVGNYPVATLSSPAAAGVVNCVLSIRSAPRDSEKLPLALPPPRFTIINQWDHWGLTRVQLVDRESELRRARLYEFTISRGNRTPHLLDELREQTARIGEAALQLLSDEVSRDRANRKCRRIRGKWRSAA